MFYVYTYLREDGSPYYVGKGSGDRAYKKWNKKDIKPPKDQTRIIIVEDNLDEQSAFDLEIKLIAQYGRKDLGTGILHNKTNGGEGSSGHKIGGWQWSAESREKRKGAGNPAFGKEQSVEIIQKKVESWLKTTGGKQNPEWIEKRANARRGKKQPEGTGEKIAAKLRGRKQSPEAVAKRAESCRLSWAGKKALNI